MSAPYSGGSDPGSQLFFIDGDFTVGDPCGMPVISYPMKGDSILSLNDIVVFDPVTPVNNLIPLGTYPNIHPWNPNQQVAILEQEFIVAQNSFYPMPLNTPYDVSWSLGFQDTLSNGYPSAQIGSMVLVEEGELQDIGGGFSKIRRKWATIPPTRCEMEQYVATFIGLDGGDTGISRPQFTQNVMSRIQYDYFIFDDQNILGTPLFDAGGNRLNSSTGLYPAGFIILAQQYFDDPDNIISAFGVYIGTPPEEALNNDPDFPTVPTVSEYLGWVVGLSTSNGLPAEICIESSTITRWMGNIWERRTRFVQAQ